MGTGNEQRIGLEREDMREGLRLLRAERAAHDALHAAENEYQVWASQMAALYGVPAGWMLADVVVGFVPAGEEVDHD